MNKIQEVYAHLKSHDIRPSVQRVSIMQYLMESKEHPTIDLIYKDLLPYVPTLSKTTVYNTLKLFHEKKAVAFLTIDEKSLCFDANESSHDHFKCRKCGRVFDIPAPAASLDTLQSEIALYPDERQVYYYGMCGDCK